MKSRSSLSWVALVFTLVAAHADAQCGFNVMTLGPGCNAPGTPGFSIEVVGGGSTLDLSIDSQYGNSLGELFASSPLLGGPWAIGGCLIHVDPSQIVETHAFQTNAQGDYAVTVVVPDLPQLHGMTFVLQAALAFQNAPVYGWSATNALLATVGCAEGNSSDGKPTEGCGVLFWQEQANFPSWPSQYPPNTPFSSVFEDAFPGLTLIQVLQQGGIGLNALGRQTVAALLNAATIPSFPLTTAQVISMFNAAFPSANYNVLIEAFLDLNLGDCPLGGPFSGEGCAVTFWSLEANFPSWPSQYTPNTPFSSVFENAFPGLTLIQVLQQTGTGLNALGRQTVAALLNAATIPGFPLTTAQVISMFNAVFPGGNYNVLTETFLDLNLGDCPFGGPSSGEGCSHGFWKQEHHFQSWPSQYSPSAQFSSVFEDAFPGLTLLQVLEQGGGGLNALGREVVTALLNAATIPGFPLTTAQVITMFNEVFPGGDYETLKDTLEELHSGTCPF